MTISQSALAVVALAGVVWCGTAVTLPTPPRTGTEPLKPGHCEEYCSRSYPEHTYPQVNGLNVHDTLKYIDWAYSSHLQH